MTTDNNKQGLALPANFSFAEFMKNPDIIKQVGVKNIATVLRLEKKLNHAIAEPEFYVGEFKIDGACWIGLLIRNKNDKKEGDLKRIGK